MPELLGTLQFGDAGFDISYAHEDTSSVSSGQGITFSNGSSLTFRGGTNTFTTQTQQAMPGELRDDRWSQYSFEVNASRFNDEDQVEQVADVATGISASVDEIRHADLGRSLLIVFNGEPRRPFQRSDTRQLLEAGFVPICAQADRVWVAPVELESGLRLADTEMLDVELTLPTFDE